MVTLNIFHFEEYGKGRIFQMVEWSAMRNKTGESSPRSNQGTFLSLWDRGSLQFLLAEISQLLQTSTAVSRRLLLSKWEELHGGYPEHVSPVYIGYMWGRWLALYVHRFLVQEDFHPHMRHIVPWGKDYSVLPKILLFELDVITHGTFGFSPSRSAYCQQEREWTEYLVPRKTIVISDPI